MKHYLSPTGEVFAFEEDGSQDSFIRSDLALLSDEELAAIRIQQAASTVLTPEHVMRNAVAKRDGLLAFAGLHIAPLQDAVDLDKATAEDVANLKLWKQYRLAVSRVSDQSGFPSTIEWPAKPA